MVRLGNPPVSRKDHIQGPAGAPSHWWNREIINVRIMVAPILAYPIYIPQFTLERGASQAFMAAMATGAAAKQNAYWEMHDLIFEAQQGLPSLPFASFAQQLGLDTPRFEKDLADETLSAKVEADFDSGIRSGVNGTPSFL